MTTQEMKCILTLADTMNFTKAALECNITQPAFSRMIVRVEQELGFKIFIRNTRSVSLTKEGEAFLSSLDRAASIFTAGIKNSRDMAARGDTLRLCCAANFLSFELAPYVVRFRREHPELVTECVPIATEDITTRLRSGGFDIGFIFSERERFSSDFDSQVLKQIPLNVLVNKSNPLSERASIHPAELENERIVALQTNAGIHEIGSYGSPLMLLNRKYGLHLKADEFAITTQDELMRVACNQNICLLTASLEYLIPPNTRMVRLEGGIQFNFTALWKRNQQSRAMNLFMNSLSDYIDERFMPSRA